jgi:hypothetical protein
MSEKEAEDAQRREPVGGSDRPDDDRREGETTQEEGPTKASSLIPPRYLASRLADTQLERPTEAADIDAPLRPHYDMDGRVGYGPLKGSGLQNPAAGDSDGVRPLMTVGPSLFALKVTSFRVLEQGGWIEMAENTYDEVIGELQRERMAEQTRHHDTMADLDRAIDVLKSLRDRQSGGAGRPTLRLTEAASTAQYKGKTILAAATHAIRSAGRALTTREVTDALLAGGLETKADLVYNGLYYAKRRGIVTRTGDRWMLTATGTAAAE